MSMLMDELDGRDFESPDLRALRWFMPTGEALPPHLADRWQRRVPNTRLINAYGPTECSDDVTHFIIHGKTTRRSSVPIGRPLGNLRMYVLDQRLKPVSLGAAGHLHVAGIGVGRGYYGDPLRTADVFMPDAFGDRPGMRMYRTGDLAFWLVDGNLGFGGRIDHQVKIRGFRIEIGEIETVMSNHPDLRETAVIARLESGKRDRFLVGFYVVATGSTPPGSYVVRAHLAQRLPDYMIPRFLLEVPELPLSPTGKIDREALRAIPLENTSMAEEPLIAQSPAEKDLAAIWQSILGLEQIGVDDDFFALGGHSLLAVQLMARIEKQFKRAIPLAEIFRHSTIRSIARMLTQSRLGCGTRDGGGVAGLGFLGLHSTGIRFFSRSRTVFLYSSRRGPRSMLRRVGETPGAEAAVLRSSSSWSRWQGAFSS